MQFNSVVFLKFLAAFLLLYHLVRGHRGARNWLIVGASYVFYGWWDYRFLTLLLASSLLDYAVGLRMEASGEERVRRRWLWASLAGNLGILGVFKYCGFFVSSLAALLEGLGLRVSLPTLQLVLPVGISFYTFQTLSYSLDVYRRQIPAARDLGAFLAYVAFFPQLVAGPIERASHLLPQFGQPRILTTARLAEGQWLVIWGLFKKVVMADHLAPLVEMAYDHPGAAGPVVVLGTVAFGFQIYADFSGYSDIARGLAKLLGFDLRWNFHLPYGASNLREFWRRWHISLSTWLRDYLYISLGGNRRGAARTRWNLLLTMLLGGLWHGAAWHFVGWGLWHGVGLLVHRWWEGRRPAGSVPRGGWAGWGLTLVFVFYGWLWFRAPSLGRAWEMTWALTDWSWPVWFGSYAINLAVFAAPLVAMQWWQGRRGDLLVVLSLPLWGQALVQGACLVGLFLFWDKANVPFLYFQF